MRLLIPCIFVSFALVSTSGFSADSRSVVDQAETFASRILESGVEIQDINLGNGTEVGAGDKVMVSYIGHGSDGKVFTDSAGNKVTASFHIGSGAVLALWNEGLLGMKVNGKRRISAPKAMVYGPDKNAAVPSTERLVYEVELITIQSSRLAEAKKGQKPL